MAILQARDEFNQGGGVIHPTMHFFRLAPFMPLGLLRGGGRPPGLSGCIQIRLQSWPFDQGASEVAGHLVAFYDPNACVLVGAGSHERLKVEARRVGVNRWADQTG